MRLKFIMLWCSVALKLCEAPAALLERERRAGSTDSLLKAEVERPERLSGGSDAEDRGPILSRRALTHHPNATICVGRLRNVSEGQAAPPH